MLSLVVFFVAHFDDDDDVLLLVIIRFSRSLVIIVRGKSRGVFFTLLLLLEQIGRLGDWFARKRGRFVHEDEEEQEREEEEDETRTAVVLRRRRLRRRSLHVLCFAINEKGRGIFFPKVCSKKPQNPKHFLSKEQSTH